MLWISKSIVFLDYLPGMVLWNHFHDLKAHLIKHLNAPGHCSAEMDSFFCKIAVAQGVNGGLLM